MSATPADTATADQPNLSDKQARILEYLRSEVDNRTYFKSRLIANGLGISAKEVGANMSAVVEAASEINIEKWGYSTGTTWMVTRESS